MRASGLSVLSGARDSFCHVRYDCLPDARERLVRTFGRLDLGLWPPCVVNLERQRRDGGRHQPYLPTGAIARQ